MADELAIRGLVTEIGIKDGTSAKGEWRKYSFNIQGHNDGQKHWYGWFNDKGSVVKTGISYYLTYTTAANEKNADHPYRNIQTMQEIDTPANASPGTSVQDDRDDKFRTKEELRFTEAMHLAAVMAPAAGDFDQQKADVIQWARWFYEMLCNAPGNDKSTVRPPAPRKASDPQESSDVAKNGASPIGPEDAAKLMQMADDLIEKDGRKWVMGEIKKRWDITDPQKLSHEQSDIIADVLNGGPGHDPVDQLEQEMGG